MLKSHLASVNDRDCISLLEVDVDVAGTIGLRKFRTVRKFDGRRDRTRRGVNDGHFFGIAVKGHDFGGSGIKQDAVRFLSYCDPLENAAGLRIELDDTVAIPIRHIGAAASVKRNPMRSSQTA